MGKGAKSRPQSCKSHGALLAHVWSVDSQAPQPSVPSAPLSGNRWECCLSKALKPSMEGGWFTIVMASHIRFVTVTQWTSLELT